MKPILFLLILFSSLLTFSQEENPLPYTEKEPIYDIAPEFVGGSELMYSYISSHIIYPEPEKSKGLEGSVSLKFVVTKKGKIESITALNGTPGAPNFVAEAMRVIESMPKWNPARKKNKKVAALYYIHVPFRLT